MSKQLIATSLFATDTKVTLRIPVAESFLPTQMIKGTHQDLPKEVIYSNDARNPHFLLTLKVSDGSQQGTRQLELPKEELAIFLQQIQKIQDELNTYM